MNRTLVVSAAVVASLAGASVLAGWTARTGTAASAAAETTAAASYAVDTVHSSLVFRIRHSGIANFYGRFNDFGGDISFDPESPTNSSMSFTVQTESVDTGNKNRDDHLRNADFFNARQFPTIEFVSNNFRPIGENTYEVTGDLTLHGETRPVTASITQMTTGKVRDKDAIGFEARFSIQRSDFGMTKYLAPDQGEGGPLGNTVDLIVAIEAPAK